MDEQEFFEAWRESGEPAGPAGIGTLSEKRMHAVLKRCYAKDPSCQEVPIGRYVADVFDGAYVTEIQTRQLRKLCPKLKAFLPDYPVRVVHPVPRCKFLVWIDPDTGEATAPRKCGKKGTALSALHELYGILPFLKEAQLTVELLLFDVQETRLQNGRGADRKKGASRLEQIPLTAPESVILKQQSDFRALLPDGLPERFTVSTFRKLTRLPSRHAYSAVHVLESVGVLALAGTEGRAAAYRVTDSTEP